MKILVLNCGSSSVKFQFIDMDGETVLAKGIVEKIGSTGALLRYAQRGEKEIREIAEVRNHDAAITLVLSTLMHPRDGVILSLAEIDGVGHRVVHGGEEFSKSVLITGEVKDAIRRCVQFAPLHNPHNLKGIEVCERLLPGKPQVGVFDTAFHQGMPPKHFLYALPYGLYRKLGIRRYGFHGTSHAYVSRVAADKLGKPLNQLRIITCHLGNGASIAAVDRGVSIDTSMGFTPLEGLVMGTRSGDVDPAISSYLMKRESLSASEVESLYNKRSGLLGISEASNDMREILEAMNRGSERHALAFSIFCYRVKKYVGAYAAALGGIDAVVFTGGIGENVPQVRKESLKGLEFMGINIEEEANQKGETIISSGPVKVMVIPTNEELAIARDTVEVLAVAAREEAAMTEEDINRELSRLTTDERRELVAMWLAAPTDSLEALRERLFHKTQKKLNTRSIRCELLRMGLIEGNEAECGEAAEGVADEGV